MNNVSHDLDRVERYYYYRMILHTHRKGHGDSDQLLYELDPDELLVVEIHFLLQRIIRIGGRRTGKKDANKIILQKNHNQGHHLPDYYH
eukprot:scaffold3341_cov165-Ochromonas_danica.AAC.16